MASDRSSGDPIADYGKTQRIVLLLDLNPLLHLQNPAPFLKALLAAVKTILSFPPLSASLFAFRPFFSSLSPLVSSSKLPTSLSLSFHLPGPTFNSLSQTLNSLPAFRRDSASPPRASCFAASLRQLVHDYAWDSVICDPMTGMFSNSDSVAVRSNLVILFSPVCVSANCLTEFLNVGVGDESLENVNAFSERFRGFFENVNDAFLSRDIHCSWVDVRYELECGEGKVGNDEDKTRFGFFESGVRSLGWGFCSTGSIILGSALVPFGLIYPEIGISSKFFGCDDSHKKVNAQLSLEILDVSGKPLECKFCDLQLVDLKMLPRNAADDAFFSLEILNSQTKGGKLKELFWGNFGKGVTKFQVKALQKYNEFSNFKGPLSDPLLVCDVSEKPGEDGKESSGNYYADKVLEMLAVDLGENAKRKSAPIWQILLSFLYRNVHGALVSLSSDSGVSSTGILKPFTVSSALLFIVDEGFHPQTKVHDIGGAKADQLSPKMKNKICDPNADLDQTGPSNKHSAGKEGRKRNNKRNSPLLQDLTWSAFCKAAFEHSEIGLEEVYFARECYNSKKMRFLKCWMKQIKKSSDCGLIVKKESQIDQLNKKEMDNRLDSLHQESEQPISSSPSIRENSLTVASGIQDEAALEFRSETSEAFFSSLSSKIQQGLEYEAVDLGALAYRLVNSSVYWLNKKQETEALSESQSSLVKSRATDDVVAAEVLKLLLRDPKDITAKQKSSGPSVKASDSESEGLTSGKIVREYPFSFISELSSVLCIYILTVSNYIYTFPSPSTRYELQIFFRMEVLQSEVGASIAESMKQKFVKQICSFLEKIRCHLEGFFGDWSVDDYVEKIIKSRYCKTLEDVVHKIYTKMDLLLFADEEELPNSLLNSEDSNRSCKEKPKRDEVDESCRIWDSLSAEGESLRPLKTDIGRPSAEEIKQEDDHARKLLEAQERRERARRFASSTRGMPDLQRVWAPKQLKPLKPKSNPLRKLFKRKDHRGSCDDRVCETPMTGIKRSCSQCSWDDDEDYREYSSQPCGSVSKALFQDDDQ
ncbi:hypothetical protein D8674_001649 [Pyrus ussuriensis x Pyrus communis]|uniref:Uncharacterized protein n=1 Tax=Pyrus ussuriensis x Pyrus communis TaxID=2448454 RepID=A0A5N5F6P8_9ROSA|nr:hypothetical protein D8674_001649 [Pyrus ussuriensis x Pyrus communis]